MDPTPQKEPTPEIDLHALHAAHERKQMLAVGLLALPNLFLRSVFTLGLLYGILGLVLISLAQFDVLTPGVAVAIGCGVVVLQFALGPWIMDLTLRFLYKMRWVQPEELPEHLEHFVRRVCDENRMRFPSFCVIDDGAPQAFTYGHHPSNARIVISRGLMTMLTPDELEAVVAHELGHARNWDMALMTLANLVPLLLYYVYQIGIRFRDSDKDNKAGWASVVIAVGAYVLYIVSEYIVLWFSRTREYYADRFAGQATGKPNALASALVKIAYGLAAQDSKEHEAAAAAEKDSKKKKEKATAVVAGGGALGALNIFDRSSAVSMVMSAATGEGATGEVDRERVKSAMQWDLWNPWAKFYELNSTHPLVAKRLLYLSDQASALGQDPYVMFDRAKPESYWDDFFVDLCVVALPLLGFLAGVGLLVGLGLGAGMWRVSPLVAGLGLMGLGALVRNWFAYRGGIFEHRTVASLVGHVKVSPVRPVPCTVRGHIIGKGVPGLIWSEDFVLRDPTGILFLDYKQPLAIWSWLFGLLRAGRYQGKEVTVKGWFRRAPTPYLEIYHLETTDGSQPSRTCYTYWAVMIGWALVATVAGLAALMRSSMSVMRVHRLVAAERFRQHLAGQYLRRRTLTLDASLFQTQHVMGQLADHAHFV
jgi:Zn-dependent protease with chaperone function